MKLTATVLPLLLAAGALGACGNAGDSGSLDASEVSGSLTTVLGEADDVTQVRNAMASTGLDTMLDGPGTSYTIIAPSDAAFEAAAGEEPLPAPVLAALLREHIIPGHLDSAAIANAIEANGGPVKIATVGQGTLEFSRDGDTLVATHSESGLSARMTGENGQAENGTLLVADALLVTPPADDAA